MEPDDLQPNDQAVLGRAVAVVAGAVIAGALAAPAVFNALLWLGRRVAWLKSLRNIEFESVASRVVLVLLVVAVAAAMKGSRLLSRTALGYTRDAGRRRLLVRWWAIGTLSMAALFAAGVGFGAYGFDPAPAPKLIARLATVLVGSLLVGFVEEGLFRGALLELLRRASGFWPAAMLSSAVFSLVHFARPMMTSGVVYGHWYSGLQLLPQMFREVALAHRSVPFAFTLFAMGLVLCLLRRQAGNLYSAIGLHAGWVFVMLGSKAVLERNAGAAEAVFGWGMDVSRSWAALAVIAAFLVAVAARRTAPEARR